MCFAKSSQILILMPKAQPLHTGAKSNLRDRALGEVEKNSFIALPGKGGHSRLLPSKTMCPNPGEFGEEFYGNGSRVGMLIRSRCVQGLHSFNLISGNLLDELLWFLLSDLRCSSPGMKDADILHFLDFNSIKGLKTWLCVSLEGEPGPCPKAVLLFLGFPSLFYAYFPFTDFSNCSNLPFGTQGESWRLEGDQKTSVPRSPTGSCLVSISQNEAMRS